MLELKTPDQARTEINGIFVDFRKPEEIDMIATVRSILVGAGLTQEATQAFDTNKYIVDGQHLGPLGQRFLLNRYWNLQLLCVSQTVEERFCLIDNGSPEDWLRLFETKIVPCLIQHRLPKVL
jgi:hypothetical protein